MGEDAKNSFYRKVMANSTEFLRWQTCRLNKDRAMSYVREVANFETKLLMAAAYFFTSEDDSETF